MHKRRWLTRRIAQFRSHLDQHSMSAATVTSTTTTPPSELDSALSMLSNPSPLRRRQLAPTRPTTTRRQGYTAVSTTNPGFPTTPQHVREAQQQRTARPGPGPSQAIFSEITTQQLDSDDTFLLSPQVTAENQRFVDALAWQGPTADMSTPAFDTYQDFMDMTRSPTNFASSGAVDPSRDFDFFGSDSALSTPSFVTFPDSSPGPFEGWISESETASTQSRRTSRRISNGILDKVANFEALGSGIDVSQHRPCTPADQSVNGTRPGSARGCRTEC